MHQQDCGPTIPETPGNDLFEILEHWVAADPGRLLYAFLDAQGAIVESLSYQQFAAAVERLALHFRQRFAARQGTPLLLCYQPGLELVCALFACNKAGFAGVPTAPLTIQQQTAWLNSVSHVLDDSGAAGMALCNATRNVLDVLAPTASSDRATLERLRGLDQLVTGTLPEPDGENLAAVRPSRIFMLQYTSGSTTDPKGVMVSHQNLIANARAVVDHRRPVAVSWLPQHHDMGLIGYYINILLSGGTTYGLAPSAFIRRPALWLETLTRYRATASSIPSFALELCLNERRVPRRLLAGFDLRLLRFLMVAAEPVHPETYAAFLDRFAACGLQADSFFAAYGLAEFTLAVTSRGRRALLLDRDALAAGRVQPADPSGARPTTAVMSCGTPLADTRVLIVDPQSCRPVEPGGTGEIWLSGSSKTLGYWRRPDLTEQVFGARLASDEVNGADYLRTGDLGFLDQGELFVCGRLKDTLIVHGRNLYPQDIELEVQRATAKIRQNAVAAFISGDDQAITVLAEPVRPDDLPDLEAVVARVRERLELPIGNLVFVAPRSIAKTSSGKIRRDETRQRYERGELEVISSSRARRPDLIRIQPAGDQDVPETLRARYGLTGDEDYSLFDAGIDSLDLIMLLHWLRDACLPYGSTELTERITVRLLGLLSVEQIFAAVRTLTAAPERASTGFATLIDEALRRRISEERRQMLTDRVYRRAGPGADAHARQARAAPAAEDILLTGGTGFLGPFLLKSLLQHTTGRIHVLVRGENAVDAGQRLRRAFLDSIGPGAPTAPFDARVNAICSDLALPKFGLDGSTWDALCERVGVIYHNGALVNYLLDYAHLRAANVAGTAHVIDFAFAGTPKVLNHVSTTFIFGWATRDVLGETDRNPDMDHLDFGYSQSKWVSEQLVLSAMQQGLAARIFRPALITPTRHGGGANPDIALRLIAFMVGHGICVNTDNQVSFMPADVTANNIVAIAAQTESLNGTFHVTRDRLETMPQITAIIGAQTGIAFEAFPLAAFVPEVIRRCTRNDLLYPLLDFLVESVDYIAAMEYKRYDNSDYRRARDRSPIALPDAPLEEVVAGIVQFLQRRNLLPSTPSG